MFHVKRHAHAPDGFFRCEAVGLQWLSAADGGVPAVRVVAVDEHSLTLERLTSVPPERAAARTFGARLARTHAAGADGFGAPPPGWTAPSGFFGPLQQPLPMSYSHDTSWGRFYAEHRLMPMLERARVTPDTREAVEEVVSRCAAGVFDDPSEEPCRLHGDLWRGNVMWTPDGVVVIDPAAHGGHRETDLAMLELFGCPHHDAVLEGYQQVRPLAEGWRDRIGLHQLHPLLAHMVLFGSGYERQTLAAARSALAA
ncbi:fructosamine kinase family protein [Mycobacterium kyogaense]|uniref:fructosamine kinase family protein n=1 Tax=Mycobacterium kyogaense TaxID=2212479 RepID=UPI000DADFB2B|nr:fructosamine kinase family protein [Mycobacterium kyogaense]